MVKRLALGVAALAAAAVTAAPAAADPVEIDTCYQTIHMPCGVCVADRYLCIPL